EPAPEPAPAAPARAGHPSGTGHRAQLIAAHRGIVLEVIGRMVRKEANAARRAAKGGPAGLRTWVEAFYLEHGATVAAALTPALHAHLAHVGSDEDPRAAAGRLAAASGAQAQARVRGLLATRATGEDWLALVEAELARWERERPAWIADQILTEELAHALHGCTTRGVPRRAERRGARGNGRPDAQRHGHCLQFPERGPGRVPGAPPPRGDRPHSPE